MEEQQVGRQRNLELAMRARHRGQQFLVTLKAIKPGVGLVSAPCPIAVGEPIVLQTATHRPAVNTVQVFAKVAKEFEGRGLFALSWEKAVSPTGMTALLEFLQTVLGICVNGGQALTHGLVDGEMAFYDFHKESVAVPSRGVSAAVESDGLEALVRRTQDNLQRPAGNTGPITRDGIVPGHSAGAGTHQAPSSAPAVLRTGPQGTPPAPQRGSGHPPERPGYHAPEADDGMVDMFGVKVSKAAWEQLENVRFSGTSPAAEKAHELARSAAAGRNSAHNPVHDEDKEHAAGGKNGKEKGPSLLRRLASKLADKD